MSSPDYKKQLGLLLEVIPEIAKEESLALHGGTAINLFHREMPRMSVDVDLTYLTTENREKALKNIHQSLHRIGKRIMAHFPWIQSVHLEEEAKLLVSNTEATIKVEVNKVKRGCYRAPQKRILCKRASQEFGVSCEMQVVEKGHLYGGKICAALDRQHPRDLFDIKFMLEKEGFSQAIKKGFLFYLISSNRPMNELLFPRFKNQKAAFENQFQGMTQEPFDYDNYEETRRELVAVVQGALNLDDKEFLLSIVKGIPIWNPYNFSSFPAVIWKLQNIEALSTQNPEKHKKLIQDFRENLFKRE